MSSSGFISLLLLLKNRKKLNMLSFNGIKKVMDHILKTQGQNQKIKVISDGARTFLR
jgi:hypothetical protein